MTQLQLHGSNTWPSALQEQPLSKAEPSCVALTVTVSSPTTNGGPSSRHAHACTRYCHDMIKPVNATASQVAG
jgi:hypothetical protein